MDITSASYLISSPSVDKCPKADRAEYAFLGRSNVGKSSLINALCGRKELAKTSGTPGKTQLINHFEITSSDHRKWYLVDLPGYGFAKRSRTITKGWGKMIEDYIRKRENLVMLFLLIDSRHEPQEIDLQFVDSLGKWRIPFTLVFTKSDKSTQKESAHHVNEFLQALEAEWEEPPPHILTSAVKGNGIRQLRTMIAEGNAAWEEYKRTH